MFSLCLLNADTKDEKILICGVAKNCESGFENIYLNVLGLSKYFKDYHVVVYENNSTDQTKNLYSCWAKCNPKITFLSEDLSHEFINSYVPRIGNYRTQFIARARNKVLDIALSEAYDDFKYVLNVDLDGFDLWNIDQIIDSIHNPQEDWDAIFANGSYDVYAFRSDQCSLGPELLGCDLWMKIYPKYGKYLSQKLQDGKWLKVNSAFGGLAIYKRDAIKKCHYSGVLAPSMIKSCLDNKFDSDIFYGSFPKGVKQRIEDNKLRLENWLYDALNMHSEYIKPFGSYDFYICEHVYFHNMMKSNGHDKLYINPNLIIRSKEHVNF